MAEVTNVFLSARRDAGDAQDRNRAWWEALPMTYADWSSDSRLVLGHRHVTHDFYAANPFLKPKHFYHGGKDVLEVGCGAGGATGLFAHHGARVTAIDITDTAVHMARQNEPRATILRMDAEDMSFTDASFDHVFSWGVIHHSASTERAVAEIARVLKPRGTGLLMVYNRGSLRYWVKGLYWLHVKKMRAEGETMDSVQRFFTDGYFHRHFTAGEFKRLLRAEGLKVTAIHRTHMAKRMIPKIPRRLDDLLKRRWGWLLVAEIEKAA